MPKGDIETYPENGVWQNRREATDEAPFGTSPTKGVAQGAGRDEAMKLKVEHIIRDENGRIAERNSYGHDPRSSKG